DRALLLHDANLRLAAVSFPFAAGMVAAAPLFIPALFTHVYDPSVPIFRVAILVTPLAALPLDGALRAMGHTRYLFRAFLGRLLLTVPAVLIGLKLFGMVGAITGHALAESAVRLVMLDRVRRELSLAWREVLPWGQLAVIARASTAPHLPKRALPCRDVVVGGEMRNLVRKIAFVGSVDRGVAESLREHGYRLEGLPGDSVVQLTAELSRLRPAIVHARKGPL